MEESIQDFPLFEDFNDKDLSQFFQKAKKIILTKDEILINQGSVGENLYFLKEGILEVFITGPNEYIHVVDNLTAPSVIGEMEFFDERPIIASIKAKSRCILYAVSYIDFKDFIMKYPVLNQKLITIILSKWRNVEAGIHQVIASMSESNEYLSEFASTVSHDLKSPLQTIKGYTQLIQRNFNENDHTRSLDYLNRIETNINTMDRLIEGIYNYSIAIQHSTEDFESVNIYNVVQQVIQLLAPSPDIKINVKDPLPVITANKVHMVQIFQNLIDNAIKSLDKPKRVINISCKSVRDFWEFSISDNGIGIKTENFDRIMRIFQRVNKNKDKGIGIGLAIVERIVVLHGGKIWVESEYGNGSTFYFTISKSILKYNKTTKSIFTE